MKATREPTARPNRPAGRTLAPGPSSHPLLGCLPELRRDPLALLNDCATLGDVARLRLGPFTVHLLNHPDHVQHVLVRNRENYDKKTRSATYTRDIAGESVLTANGPAWQKHRRLVEPAFHHHAIAGFVHRITQLTNVLCQRWQHDNPQSIDIASEMMRLTFAIAGKCLFDTDVGSQANAIEKSLGIVLHRVWHRLENILTPPSWLPTERNREFQQARGTIDNIVYDIINQHRQRPHPNNDSPNILTLLLNARDPDTGEALTNQQLRNETVTLLMAGHETTANALNWTFYLLSQHPETEATLTRELDSILADRPPTLDDLPRLKQTTMILRESMRLYPPVWILERRAIRDDEIAGYHIPKGSSVVISPYALHRHPDYWDDPDSFRPERFKDGAGHEAYIPFGAGPRSCIGSQFAMTEARIVLAMIHQRFRLRLNPGHFVEPDPGLTLRLRHGLSMTVEKRPPGA